MARFAVTSRTRGFNDCCRYRLTSDTTAHGRQGLFPFLLVEQTEPVRYFGLSTQNSPCRNYYLFGCEQSQGKCRIELSNQGQGMQADFSTEMPGSLLSVSLATQEVTVLAVDVGNIDGVVRIGETLLVSDWITGQLFEITPEGNALPVGDYAPGLADVSAHATTLYLPSMLEGTMSAPVYS